MASGYYDITNKTLGRGHYGVVKLGRHCLTGEPVAIKIIEKSRLNKDSLNQLGTEIRILFRLSEYEHPNILKLYQTIDTEDKLFLVTEYCGPHACDLHDYLLRKHGRDGLGEKEAQIFFVQICSAISYCHSMGIVHRDLKPENILVTDYRHMYTNTSERNLLHELQYPLLKLIDFGFANQWYPDEKMRTSCGTLAYSAPELLLGEPYDGTKVDVWGLGLMLYILLYGGNPFMQINDNETLTKILDCSFATPTRDNVDYAAIELLRSLIKRNPDTRLPLDSILQHKWFSGIPKPFQMILKSHVKQEQSICPSKGTQLPKMAPVVSPSLPSISESGPLRNQNRSADDEQLSDKTSCDTSETTCTYNRTRSLSITRTHTKPMQPSHHTRSSVNLERSNQNAITISPLSRISGGPSIYRPTSPDVGGSAVLSDEERKLHERVIQEMFRLTKLIDSKSGIEASLKNARFAHRQFNQSSIQPATHFAKRKVSTGLVRTLVQEAKNAPQPVESQKSGSGGGDKLGVINSKLNNDDYIYATYQLTRDKILRKKQEQLSRANLERDQLASAASSQVPIPEEDVLGLPVGGFFPQKGACEDEGGEQATDGVQGVAVASGKTTAADAKENGGAGSRRKLLQPQHRMRDKFTSFFRSGSTSPSGSFNLSSASNETNQQQQQMQQPGFHDTSSSSVSSPPPSLIGATGETHEAFSELNNETSGSVARYFGNMADSFESSCGGAYALPLARKCSLVSEESNCSTDLTDSQLRCTDAADL